MKSELVLLAECAHTWAAHGKKRQLENMYTNSILLVDNEELVSMSKCNRRIKKRYEPMKKEKTAEEDFVS